MDSLEAARLYASLGWNVFPLVGKKPPKGFRWKSQCSSNGKDLQKWFPKYANIGVVCGEHSGICVIDVDPRNGGHNSLERLEQELGKLPGTLSALSGGNGSHYVFRWTEESDPTPVGESATIGHPSSTPRLVFCWKRARLTPSVHPGFKTPAENSAV